MDKRGKILIQAAAANAAFTSNSKNNDNKNSHYSRTSTSPLGRIAKIFLIWAPQFLHLVARLSVMAYFAPVPAFQMGIVVFFDMVQLSLVGPRLAANLTKPLRDG